MITPQFILECLNGSDSAIQTLVRAHQRGVFQIALTVIDDGAAPVKEAANQAELATRDTFITALDRIAGYHEDLSFTTWLYRIAVQVSRRRARRWRRERMLRTAWRFLTEKRKKNASVESGGTEARPLKDAAGSELLLAVRRLKESLRLPVVLRYYHDFAPTEIACLLQVGEGTVHARLDAAREMIAKITAEAEPGDD